MTRSSAPCRPGDQLDVYCDPVDGPTGVYPFTVATVTRLTDGTYRLSGERPAGTGRLNRPAAMEVTVDRQGRDLDPGQPDPGGRDDPSTVPPT